MAWCKARKKPVVIEFREVQSKEHVGAGLWGEYIDTMEGRLYALPNRDFIIRVVKGAVYPIKKEIFYETYDVVEEGE